MASRKGAAKRRRTQRHRRAAQATELQHLDALDVLAMRGDDQHNQQSTQ